MTEQLVLELAPPEPPSFANFLPGANGEALDALMRMANGTVAETGLLLWGAVGAGKTHLLRATVEACEARGQRAVLLATPQALFAAQPHILAPASLVAIDDVDQSDATAQARLFTLYNALRASGAHLLVASAVPPARLSMREDMRTRLGWGLVYEIALLADADKPAALKAYARQRGFRLGDDVVAYLLAHGQRDMTTLLATLAALDRYSLASKRAITIPLLRAWLQRV